MRGRLFAAFLLVALSSVAVLTAAALAGTGRGLAAAESTERDRAATRAADEVAAAYRRARGWTGLDLTSAASAAAGAHLIVLDEHGRVVSNPGHGHGGPGMGTMSVADHAEAPVMVDGTTVGSVRLTYGATAGSAARDVTWLWIAVAAATALAVAIAASWFVSRRITDPLTRLAAAARAFAIGDRSARARVRAPGELGTLATAFDTMADAVTNTERNRRDLTADVAHELRTPLAALRAGLEELRDGLAPADPHRLSDLHDQALRLGRVVDDLAALAAAEAAALSLHPTDVDLAVVAESVLGAHAAQLRATGLEVHTELAHGVIIHADPDRLHQALGNVVANAARYGRPGDRLTVRAGMVDGTPTVSVSDTGPGIPEDELPHVFDRMWRGRGSATIAGSGIGLAVVRELVTAHRGSVTAESGPGGGTTITIRLPGRKSRR
ncbi:HAMP domain-containing sensor histidine kinase [Actinophytocola sp.]|uniref:sensor histidine kinase n=1 Tax=Actinophytocola sp. TaxID=1872138 RepID=UPI0025C23985|nr:HAMP domain-containing sensor histidine kinase [Actinophytocola sp.]